MPIPVEILSVERPKNTRVKKSGEKYLVIKRTCKRVNGRNVPVLYKKVRMSNGKYLYAYRDTRAAFEQETGYVERSSRKKGGMDPDTYLSKYKMVRTTENGKWLPSKRLKYIEELCMALGI